MFRIIVGNKGYVIPADAKSGFTCPGSSRSDIYPAAKLALYDQIHYVFKLGYLAGGYSRLFRELVSHYWTVFHSQDCECCAQTSGREHSPL